jgi:hypothetical protein
MEELSRYLREKLFPLGACSSSNPNIKHRQVAMAAFRPAIDKPLATDHPAADVGIDFTRLFAGTRPAALQIPSCARFRLRFITLPDVPFTHRLVLSPGSVPFVPLFSKEEV